MPFCTGIWFINDLRLTMSLWNALSFTSDSRLRDYCNFEDVVKHNNKGMDNIVNSFCSESSSGAMKVRREADETMGDFAQLQP
jgi:hypothetical protein